MATLCPAFVLFLVGCRSLPDTAACRVTRAPAPGPLAQERASAEGDPLRVAEILLDEGFLTSDGGFYTLAEQALQCAEDKGQDPDAIARSRAELLERSHRFAESATLYASLAARTDDALDYAELGESLMNQGRLDEAAVAMQQAADRSSSPLIEGRAALLRWAWGDLDGAIELAEQANRGEDPVVRAWALALAGWYHALRGDPSPQLDQALTLSPTYATARYFRGRVRLHAGDRAGAEEDLRLAGRTLESLWALSELDPTVDPLPACDTSPRGCGVYLAERDPTRARALIESELVQRGDAPTRIARAYVASLQGEDTRAEVTEALRSGTREPVALLQAGLVLDDPLLLRRALDAGPGLLPSERARALAALGERP